MFSFEDLFSGSRRFVSKHLVKVLKKTRITPNQVTLIRILVALPILVYFFSQGKYFYNLMGLLFVGLLTVFDCVDGDLARETNQTSVLGAWLDEYSDRITMVVMLMSIFFGALTSSPNSLWPLVIILFFLGFFLLDNLLSQFDKSFKIHINRYSKVREKMKQLRRNPSLSDRFYISFLHVHGSPLAAFSFCISYPLLVGIIFNQLLVTFIFTTVMINFRFLVLLQIYYRVLNKKKDPSVFVQVLKKLYQENA